jgi:hypothetical protein
MSHLVRVLDRQEKLDRKKRVRALFEPRNTVRLLLEARAIRVRALLEARAIKRSNQ